MAALTLPRRSIQGGLPIDMNLWSMVEPQGAEDEQLRKNAESAVAHWESRTEWLVRAGLDSGDYVSVPFEPVKKIRVTYRHVGILKPAPYPLDE